MILGSQDASTFRVFLSLRFAEHGELARTVVDRLRRYFVLGVFLDDGRADASSATQRSLRELERSDVVVLFIGETRGTADEGGLTIVEREFREALLSRKPVLAYVSPTVNENSATWPFLCEVRDSALVIGRLPASPGEAAMCVVADIQSVPLGSGDLLNVGPLLTSAGVRDEAGRLGFGDHLVDRPRDGLASVRLDLLQHQAWAFEAIDDGHPAQAVEHLLKARKIRRDDWLTNYSLAWVTVNTGSRSRLGTAIEAGRTAEQTAERWRSTTDGPEQANSYVPARLDASHGIYGRETRDAPREPQTVA